MKLCTNNVPLLLLSFVPLCANALRRHAGAACELQERCRHVSRSCCTLTSAVGDQRVVLSSTAA